MPSPTSPGAALAELRPQRTVICGMCGRSFTARDTRATFCSNKCRQANKYAKLKLKRGEVNNEH